MIGKDEIAEASRNADAISEEHRDLPRFWRERGVDIEGLEYVAEQRALRAGMVFDGQSPNFTRSTPVYLSPQAERLQPLLAAVFIDGFAAGFTVKDDEHGEPA
jgi:hypothetical protein